MPVEVAPGPAEPERVHIPVLRDRIVELLRPALDTPGAVLVDGTLGLGGHAAALLAAAPRARLIGIDRDQGALDRAARRLEPFRDRVELVRARFDELGDVLAERHIDEVQAVLLDLGLSSLQIDAPERGFAYSYDAPLDMRMDDRQRLDATRVVNEYSRSELVRVLRTFGEEPGAARIADAIVKARAERPIDRTGQLVRVITDALPAAVKYGSGGHPAKRSFQAIRIEVNGELEALERLLPVALRRLSWHGRMAVLAYHSLEDRLVKQAFARVISDAAPPELPVVPEHLLAQFELLTHRGERPNAAEIAANPRAASAHLRAVVRIRKVCP